MYCRNPSIHPRDSVKRTGGLSAFTPVNKHNWNWHILSKHNDAWLLYSIMCMTDLRRDKGSGMPWSKTSRLISCSHNDNSQWQSNIPRSINLGPLSNFALELSQIYISTPSGLKKMATILRRVFFYVHFLDRNVLYFDSIVPRGLIDWKSAFDAGDGLALNKKQAINWNNDVSIRYVHVYISKRRLVLWRCMEWLRAIEAEWHFCVSVNQTPIGSDNALSHFWHWAIIWTNDG